MKLPGLKRIRIRRNFWFILFISLSTICFWWSSEGMATVSGRAWPAATFAEWVGSYYLSPLATETLINESRRWTMVLRCKGIAILCTFCFLVSLSLFLCSQHTFTPFSLSYQFFSSHYLGCFCALFHSCSWALYLLFLVPFVGTVRWPPKNGLPCWVPLNKKELYLLIWFSFYR